MSGYYDGIDVQRDPPVTARHDKATEGRTGAAAVDQAIADVEKALAHLREWNLEAAWDGKKALAALRVLADAVEELRLSLYSRDILLSLANGRLEAAEAELATLRHEREGSGEVKRLMIAENVRLARQVTDLERALEWYAERRNHASPAGTPSMPPSSGGWLGTNDSFDGDGPGARARAALAAARSRDPQKEVSEETTNT